MSKKNIEKSIPFDEITPELIRNQIIICKYKISEIKYLLKYYSKTSYCYKDFQEAYKKEKNTLGMFRWIKRDMSNNRKNI